MKPPFEITPEILNLCSDITRLIGQLEGFLIERPSPQLRKSNRVRTIQASLAIEGNTLELEQVTDILDGKRVIGSKKEILEVQNAINAYDLIPTYKSTSEKSFRQAHAEIMKGLISDQGKWRNSNVGIFRGEQLAHAAPQAKQVPVLMKNLFQFLKAKSITHPLILSAVFHYELEFIHPFTDGNGRMGRLWQTVLLKNYHPLFEFTPIESVVRDRQDEYYKALGRSDRKGTSNPFVEFSLSTILEALESMKISFRPEPLNSQARLGIAKTKLQAREFTRKDYLAIFKTISTATASRDLAEGVSDKILKISGDKRSASYSFKK